MAALPTFESASFAEALTIKFKDESQFACKIFTVKAGKRFDKIMQGRTEKPESIHAFVERETGFVYKAAGINKPAEGVRFMSVDQAVEVADVYGGYLYRRG